MINRDCEQLGSPPSLADFVTSKGRDCSHRDQQDRFRVGLGTIRPRGYLGNHELKRLCCGRVQQARAPRYAGLSLRRTPVGTGHRRHRRPSARDASDRGPAENMSLRTSTLPMARISRPAAKLVSPRTEASVAEKLYRADAADGSNKPGSNKPPGSEVGLARDRSLRITGEHCIAPACAGAPPHRRGRGQFGGRDGRGAGDADRHRGAGCRTGACARAHKGACVREGGREEREERKNSCWVWN